METRPGYRTTELWMTVVVLLLNNINALPIPDKYQGLLNVLGLIGYQISRGLAKQGVPNNIEDTEGDPAHPLLADLPVTTPADAGTDEGDVGKVAA